MIGVPIHDPVCMVWPCLGLQHLRQPLALRVGVVPEVEEEQQENQAVQEDNVNEDGELVGAVLQVEILGDVAGHHDKLDLDTKKGENILSTLTDRIQRFPWPKLITYQLDRREVLLPPQILLVFGAHGSQPIVCVHDHVDNTVQQGMECSHSTLKKGGDVGKSATMSHKKLRRHLWRMGWTIQW